MVCKISRKNFPEILSKGLRGELKSQNAKTQITETLKNIFFSHPFKDLE